MKWYLMRWAQKYWGKEARERYRRYLQSDAWKTKRKAVLLYRKRLHGLLIKRRLRMAQELETNYEQED